MCLAWDIQGTERETLSRVIRVEENQQDMVTMILAGASNQRDFGRRAEVIIRTSGKRNYLLR